MGNALLINLRIFENDLLYLTTQHGTKRTLFLIILTTNNQLVVDSSMLVPF